MVQLKKVKEGRKAAEVRVESVWRLVPERGEGLREMEDYSGETVRAIGSRWIVSHSFSEPR